jgi:DNA-binding CsgD family transcriptional regulator
VARGGRRDEAAALLGGGIGTLLAGGRQGRARVWLRALGGRQGRVRVWLRALGVRPGPRGPPARSAGGWESLAATERAASLVADGLTNGAVARRLSIWRHIVNTHLRHVFAKLGVPDRAALAAVVHHSIR